MPLEGVPGPQRAGGNEGPGTRGGAPPHQMIGGDVERVTGLRPDPQDVLDAVGLGRDHLGQTVRVEDLRPHRVRLHQGADGNQTGRRADEGVIGLARRDLLRRGGSHVEPDRRVEAEDLVEQHPGQFVLEDLGVGARGEVAVLAASRAVGVHDPVDQLPQRPLPARRAGRPAEVLAGNNVGGVHRPELRELHSPLLEVDRAVPPVGHDDVPGLPGDLVVRVDAGGGA